MTISTWIVGLLAAAFLAWLFRAVFVVFVLREPWRSAPLNADEYCTGISASCGAITGWVTSLLSIALASAVFLLWRFWRVQRRYRAKARRHARDLVPTAGPIFGQIVGRDDLCHVVMEDLRDRHSRRPHVLVGGVGTGKTAVLVLLTEMLAKRNAVPVPIRLRDTEPPFHFEDLARKQFLETINEQLVSVAEGEKVWRRLLQDGRIVVLADGLEEALTSTQDDEERNSKIRLAIRRAYDQRLPLLIASRPHSPLRDMDATIHELEPLSDDAALTYVEEDGPTEDERRLSWIVDTADVADAPLYLQITKDIYRLDMLDKIAKRQTDVLGAPGEDPSRLRLRLLQTWEQALIGGDLSPDVPLRPEEREVTVEWLSALACAGLRDDTLEVRLDSTISQGIISEVESRRAKIDDRTGHKLHLDAVTLPLAAAWAARLDLVEPLDGRVRFRHSLIQAYLGSRLMGSALLDREYMTEALYGAGDESGRAPALAPAARGTRAGGTVSDPAARRTGPGREFLIALVLHSRSRLIEEEDAGRRLAEGPVPSPVGPGTVCRTLADAAAGRNDNKALDIYAAALEISSIAPDHGGTAHGADRLPDASSAVLASLATTGIGYRQEIVIRVPADSAGDRGTSPDRPDAQAANSMSHVELADQISGEWPEIRSEDPQTLEEAKLGLVCRFGDALRTLAERRHECSDGLGYVQLYQICRMESSYRIRLAATQEIGRGGAAAFAELEPELAVPGQGEEICSACRKEPDANSSPGGHAAPPGSSGTDGLAGDQVQWAQQVSAWLAPLLITSVAAAGGDHWPGSAYQRARDHLKQWLQHVGPDEGHQGRLTISQEIALAQGFKYAANRRYGHVHALPPTLGYLQEEALEMLKHARYWFSQLTLIQALCLWEIQASESAPSAEHRNPDAIVNHWLDQIGEHPSRDGRGGRRIHPFVQAAAILASRAIETGHPERFLWMDESDLVTRIGSSREMTASQRRLHDQWILPSMGWSGLDRHAQQLVADVLLLLNLAERGEQPGDIERWLERANNDLVPPCISRDRVALKPDCTVGTAERNPPGSSCLDGCAFDLCPYPPKGLQPHRAELSEAFCRHQYMLVRRARIGRRTASWQGLRPKQMRAFWSEMADRARIGPAGK